MLEVEIERAGYAGGTALTDVSFAVEAGDLFGILGANGAGKSTLLRVIAGLEPPNASGRVLFEGVDLMQRPAHARAALRIGHVPEGRRVFRSMSVRENLLVGGIRTPPRQRAARVAELLDRFPEIGRRATQPAGSLSGGEQQILAIGRALMTDPRLLILDEPSLGLAPLVVLRVFDLLRDLNERDGLTILLVEQNAFEALQLITHACLLDNGRVVASGTASQLRTSDEVAGAYLGSRS
jgi:branched-chain amino acid transport system ATP-binding protein